MGLLYTPPENLKMDQGKRRFLLETIIFRVPCENFRGSKNNLFFFVRDEDLVFGRTLPPV